MAVFEVEASGQRYEVEAPSMDAAASALRTSLGMAPTPAATGPDQARQGKGSIQTGPDTSERPSLLARAADAFTGSLRTEFPDAPEFGAALTAASRARGEAAPGALGILGSLFTPDPAAQLDILRRHFPGIESRNDVHGNVMLRLPSAGVNDWTYLNRPGLSARDVGEFLIPAVATAPIGGPAMGAGRSVLARVGTGAAAGAGASVASDLAAVAAGSEQGVDPLRATISGVVGGALGPLVPRAAVPGRAAPAPTAGQEAVLAGERIGVPVPRAMASDSRITHMVGGSTRALPFGSPLEGATERTAEALGEAATQVAQGFGRGGASDAFNAGQAARDGMLDWIRGGSAAVDRRLYGAVDRLINPQARLRLGETMSTVQDLAAEMAASHGTANRGAIALVLDAINAPQGLTYHGVQRLRTEIGARISGDIVPEAGTAMPALRRIYEALSVDLRRIVEHAGGPQAVRAYNRAENVHRLIAQRREDLARIMGTQGEMSPERVVERLLAMARGGGTARADINRLMQARRAMGADAWNEVASAAVAQLGRAPDGAFSPARFVTAYGKLSPAGRDALFNTTLAGQGGLRQALDDIMTVSQRFQETMSRYANPSGTGRAVTSVAGIYGSIASPLETLTAAVGGYGMAHMLARPVTAQAVARYMHAAMQAATRPGQATAMLVQQAQRQLFEAATEEGIDLQGQGAQQ